MKSARDAGIIILTAGIARKLGQTRLELAKPMCLLSAALREAL